MILLCALVVGASVVSKARPDWYTGMSVRIWPDDEDADPNGRKWIVVLTANHGSLSAGVSHHAPVRSWIEFQNDYGPANYNPFAHQLGFGVIWSGGYYTLFVPWWFSGAAAMLLGACAARRLMRRTGPAGVCRRCGYDLRATPDRCPECGEVVARGGVA